MRWLALALCIAASAAAPVGTLAQSMSRAPLLCFLAFDPPSSRTTRFAAFFDALHALGYVDGQTIRVHWASALGEGSRYPAVAADCLRHGADVIVASTTPGALAAKSATSTVPIVMLNLGDPLAVGLVDNLSRPGGNVTGTSILAPGMAAKRLELLRDLVPGIARVLILTYAPDPISKAQIAELTAASRTMHITPIFHDVYTPDDIPGAFDKAVAAGVQAIQTTIESIFAVEHARLMDLGAKLGVPIVSYSATWVQAGGLISYAPHIADLHSRTATYVDRILKGAKPSELPVQQPTRFELVINLKTARALGIDVPRTLLDRADRVIE